MSSRCIESYFGYSDSRPPRIFSLSKDPSATYGMTARFIDKPMQDQQCVGKVMWHDARTTVELYGDPALVGDVPFMPADPHPYQLRHLKLLKSNLQKSIRRMEPQSAADTAYTMACLDVIQLLQRIGIIWIEDCGLSWDYAIVVWFLAAATKKWLVTARAITITVDLAGRLAALPTRDVNGSRASPYPVTRIRSATSCSRLRSLLYALQFRRGFQSLGGDKKMIDQCISDWVDRGSPDLSVFALREAQYDEASILHHGGILRSAVDQHCSGICSVIADRRGISERKICEAVWCCSSRTSKKGTWTGGRRQSGTRDEVEGVWTSVASDVRGYAEWWLGVTVPALV